MSSGLVKSRTSRTFSPLAAQATASWALKTTRPVAAPGPAGRPLALTRPSSTALQLVLRPEDGPQQLVELLGLDAHERLVRRDEPLVGHVHGDADRGEAGALAVARLEHEEAALLDGELEVLHVAELGLERLADRHELVEHVRPDVLELDHLARGAHAGHHILTLCVDEELAVELVLAAGGVAREGHAGAAVVAAVAVDHGLDVDRGAPVVGDVVHAAVGDGAVVAPAAEDGADGAPELGARVVGEVLARALLDRRLELRDEVLEVVGDELGVVSDTLGLLHRLEALLEDVALVVVLGLAAEDDVAVHADEAPVAVVGETRVAGGADHALDGLVVEAQVEDRVHHPRHGGTGAGAHAEQQRVGGVAERLARVSLQGLERVLDLGVDALRVVAVRGVVVAHLGGDGEARRHRQPDGRHLGEVRPLAPEELPHGLVALAEAIDVLVTHPDCLPGILSDSLRYVCGEPLNSSSCISPPCRGGRVGCGRISALRPARAAGG